MHTYHIQFQAPDEEPEWIVFKSKSMSLLNMDKIILKEIVKYYIELGLEKEEIDEFIKQVTILEIEKI